MSQSWPTTSRRVSESSPCCLSEENYCTMDQKAVEQAEAAKTEKSEDVSSCDAKSDEDSNLDNEGDDEDKDDEALSRQTRSLLSRLDDFRQSYNRTHGQVCEFFEQARVVQKLGLLEPSLAAKLLPLSGDEGEDDDGNSAADCNYADGQKTTGMKRKLRKWRKVMRSALSEICPDMGLENTPDINPGLMKHIVDEVRSLKSQLAFQHSNIIQLAQKTEMYLQDSQQKEQFIADLLQNCKGIRFESSGARLSAPSPIDGIIKPVETESARQPPLPDSLDDIQFGKSKDLLSVLQLDSASLNTTEIDDLIVKPQDFAELQKRNRTFVQSDSALDTSNPSLYTTENSGHSTPCVSFFIRNLNEEGHLDLGSEDSTANRSNHSSARDRSLETTLPHSSDSSYPVTPSNRTPIVGCSSNVVLTSTGPCRDSSSNVVMAPAKKRNFFMSLGGSLTMAVLGGVAVGTMQKKCQT